MSSQCGPQCPAAEPVPKSGENAMSELRRGLNGEPRGPERVRPKRVKFKKHLMALIFVIRLSHFQMSYNLLRAK